MELERYWGGLKQEYENIEYHRLRAHSETFIRFLVLLTILTQKLLIMMLLLTI